MHLGKLTLPSCAAILTLSSLGAGQNPSAPVAPSLKVYSRETIVDITVTDAKGSPVHGLTQSDFTVKEDNKPQPVRSFEEFPPDASQDAALPDLPPNTYSNRPPPAIGPVNIILLDALNTAPADPTQVAWAFSVQTRVKQDSKQFLKTMQPGTRIILLGLSKGLRVLQSLCTDPALLSAAVDTMEMNVDDRGATMKEWGNEQDMRNRMTLEALDQIAADTASIKGKKNLIWFSAGLPTITDPRVNSGACNGCLPDYTRDLQKTYSLLAASQVAIYPVGAPMLLPVPNDIGPGLRNTTSTAAADEHLSYEAVAEATGGAAFYNSNDLAALVAKAVDKGANYYTLSYVPSGWKYDYSHHTIKISVDKPDLHLVYRQSYDAIDPATIKPTSGLAMAPPNPIAANSHPDLEVEMHAAMGRAMPNSTQLMFNVYVEPAPAGPSVASSAVLGTLDPKLKGKPLTRYSFLYNMPASRLAFLSSPDGSHHGSLELDLAAYDTDGRLVTGLSQIVKMPISDAQFQSFLHGPFHFLQQLDLPSGQFFLRIGILDHTSGKIGTLEIPLIVPNNPAPR